MERPETLRVTLNLPIKVGDSLRNSWLPLFMDGVSQCIGAPLPEEVENDRLAIHSWRAHETFHGAWAGQISIQLNDKAELSRINESLHGKALEICGHGATIGVDSKYINMGIYS